MIIFKPHTNKIHMAGRAVVQGAAVVCADLQYLLQLLIVRLMGTKRRDPNDKLVTKPQ